MNQKLQNVLVGIVKDESLKGPEGTKGEKGETGLPGVETNVGLVMSMINVNVVDIDTEETHDWDTLMWVDHSQPNEIHPL